MKAHQNYLSPVDILWCKVDFVFLQNAKKKENSQFWIGCTSKYEKNDDNKPFTISEIHKTNYKFNTEQHGPTQIEVG